MHDERGQPSLHGRSQEGSRDDGKYRALFEQLPDAYCVIKLIFDDAGCLVDFL